MNTTDASDRGSSRGNAIGSSVLDAEHIHAVQQLAASAVERPGELPIVDLDGDSVTKQRTKPLGWEAWLLGFVILAVIGNGLFRWAEFVGLLG